MEADLYASLPQGKATYFGLDVVSAQSVLSSLLPEEVDLEAVTDRVRRVVGFTGAEGEIGAVAYGRFSPPFARIILRRSGFERRDPPDWAPRRGYFVHGASGLYAVVIGPGAIAVGTKPPEEVHVAYASAVRPFGPIGDSTRFPVSLISAADGAVVARFDRLNGVFAGPLARASLETGAAWIVRSGEDTFSVDAELWFADTSATGAYAALLRLTAATWLSTRLSMERTRVRSGLSVRATDTGIRIALPPLSSEEIAAIVAYYADRGME
jgi:hypothetical protein